MEEKNATQQPEIKQEVEANYSTGYKKNWKKWVLIYGVIGLILYGGVYYFFLAKNKANPYTYTTTPTTPQAHPTISYQLYKSGTYGFEFSYPSSWFLQDISTESNGTGVPFRIVFNDNPTVDRDHQKVDVFLEEQTMEQTKRLLNFGDMGMSIKSTFENETISGIPVVKATSTSYELDPTTHQDISKGGTYSVLIPLDKYVLHINADIMYKPILDQMASSFKLASTQADNQSWKTYINALYNFSIQYPSSFLLYDGGANGVEFLTQKPLGGPSNLEGVGIYFKGSEYTQEFTALFNAEKDADVEEAHHAVDVKVQKIRNLQIQGYDAVEFIHDGTIPSTSGLGRGPIGYTHRIIIKLSTDKYIQLDNSSMQSANTIARDTIFNQMITSLSFSK